jgi:hypothetical protein
VIIPRAAFLVSNAHACGATPFYRSSNRALEQRPEGSAFICSALRIPSAQAKFNIMRKARRNCNHWRELFLNRHREKS